MDVNSTIADNDHFSIENYPNIAAEVTALRNSIADIQTKDTTEIILTFLKDHSIRAEFVTDADPIATLIRSRGVSIKHMETLFANSRQNKPFQKEFEEYLSHQFEKPNQG
jgi:hypothetical protein